MSYDSRVMMRLNKKVQLLSKLLEKMDHSCKNIHWIEGEEDIVTEYLDFVLEVNEILGYFSGEEVNDASIFQIEIIMNRVNPEKKFLDLPFLEDIVDSMIDRASMYVTECERTQRGINKIRSSFLERYYQPGGKAEQKLSRSFFEKSNNA